MRGAPVRRSRIVLHLPKAGCPELSPPCGAGARVSRAAECEEWEERDSGDASDLGGTSRTGSSKGFPEGVEDTGIEEE